MRGKMTALCHSAACSAGCSASFFKSARPCSNCLPTILSQFMNTLISFPRYGCAPLIAQVTLVEPPCGAKLNSIWLSHFIGFVICRRMAIFDAGRESVTESVPAQLPSKSTRAPVPDDGLLTRLFTFGSRAKGDHFAWSARSFTNGKMRDGGA